MTIDEAKSMLIAKANCIDNQCKGIYEDCNESLCDNCDLCYAQGTNGEQIKLLRQCAEWLEELKAYRTLDKTNFSDGFNKAIDEILSIVKYYADKWDGIYHAIKRIEELKGELK